MSENANQNSSQNMQERKAGALWIRTSDKGNKYLSLEVELEGRKLKLMGFDNKFYSENPDKQPKYRLFFTQETFDSLSKVSPAVAKTTPTVKKEVKVVSDEDVDL